MILNRTIILVEDSDSDRILFSKYIKQMGYDCICMDSADKLLAQLAGIEPSVILMDIEMPGISGLEAAGIIRKQHEPNGRKHIVIALTAHNDDKIKGILAEAGFDDYMQKPITKNELKTRLARYFQSESDTCSAITSAKSVNSNQIVKFYTLEMFDGDEPEFVRSIVEMFVKNTPVSIEAIKKAYEQDDMEILRQQAHKLKPHFSFFGADNVQKAMQMIEDIGRSNNNKERLPELIDCAEKTSILMIEQMKTDLLS